MSTEYPVQPFVDFADLSEDRVGTAGYLGEMMDPGATHGFETPETSGQMIGEAWGWPPAGGRAVEVTVTIE